MTSADDVATEVVEWVMETVPDLRGAYDYAAEKRDEPLPDVACEITDEAFDNRPPSFLSERSVPGIDQIALYHLLSAELLLVVDPEPPRGASRALNGYVAAIATSLLPEGKALGSGLFISPLFTAGYRPPFVEFDDGQRGRLATVRLTVAESIDA